MVPSSPHNILISLLFACSNTNATPMLNPSNATNKTNNTKQTTQIKQTKQLKQFSCFTMCKNVINVNLTLDPSPWGLPQRMSAFW